MPSMLGASRRGGHEVRGVHGLSNLDFGFLWNTWENMVMDFFKRWSCGQGSCQFINAFYFIVIKGHINCNNYTVCVWVNVIVG